MNNKSDKYIEVDGVIYDISSGRVVSDNKKHRASNKKNSVLDLRTPHNIVASSQRAIQRREVQSSVVAKHVTNPNKTVPLQRPASNTPQRTISHQKSVKPQNRTTAKNNSQEDTESQEYFGFVLINGIFAKGNLKLWQLSLFRTIFSPQTWLLLTLPLIVLQVRIIKHYTLNETIQKAKFFVAPDHYQAVSLALGITLVVFLFGVVVRSCITATGISTRLREIDNRPIKILSALRSAMHSIIRQALNYVIHLIIIVIITLGLLFVAKNLLNSVDPWIINSRYQILVAIFLIWLITLIFLYTKHWLQVGLLARSSKTSHIQLKSIKLLFTTPLANITSGTMGIFLILLCYGIILSMSWYATSFFISQTGAPAIVILILIAFVTVVLLTTLQYVQQSLWARQYYYSSLNSDSSSDLLYMEPSKPDSIWPMVVVVGILSVFMIVYFWATAVYASRLRGVLANIHAGIPDEINIVIPIRK
jgi:hypothetical protein